MTGQEIYEILAARGVLHIHHANSIKTSLSQLKLGGLASRQRVEQEGLPQTWQYTDNVDRQFGIWGDVFADTVDIHARISDRNKYGPVLFVLNSEILNSLPNTSRVLITRLNPSKWSDGQPDSERYFLNTTELNSGLSIGNFDQMLVIRTKEGIIPFGNYLRSIILDEPRSSNTVSQEYSNASRALSAAALSCGLQVHITRRQCAPHCRCTENYTERL